MRIIGSSHTDGLKQLKIERVAFVDFFKGFDNDGNQVTVNPRYNANYQHTDMLVPYNAGDTLIKVTASKEGQDITISQKRTTRI